MFEPNEEQEQPKIAHYICCLCDSVMLREGGMATAHKHTEARHPGEIPVYELHHMQSVTIELQRDGILR
jgi:hypothetical protein